MDLPERVRPFLKALERFFDDPSMAFFVTQGTLKYFGDSREADEGELDLLMDYILFQYVDASGKGYIDHFLAAHTDSLSKEEVEVYRALRENVLGFFQVEAVQSGEGLTVRECGTERTFEIVEHSASKDLSRRSCIAARLIPYRGHWEFNVIYGVLPPETAYTVERLAKKASPGEWAQLMDPVELRRIFFSSSPRRVAVNEFEAKLFAAQALAEAGLRITVEDIQKRFQKADAPLQALRGVIPESFDSMESVRGFIHAMGDLWNFTPLEKLDGHSPQEEHRQLLREGRIELPPHLAQDLLATIMSEIEEREFRTEEEKCAFVDLITDRWHSTPQAELNGLSPNDMLQGAVPYRLPDPSLLPPPDSPLPLLKDTRSRISDLVRRGKRALLALSLVHLARKNETLPEAAVREVLDRGSVEDFFLYEIARSASRPTGEQVAAIIAERASREDLSRLNNIAFFCLASFNPEKHSALLEKASQSASTIRSSALLCALRRVNRDRMIELARRHISETDSLWGTTQALGFLIQAGDTEGVGMGTEKILGFVKGREDTALDTVLLAEAFGTYGVISLQGVLGAISSTAVRAEEPIDISSALGATEDVDAAFRTRMVLDKKRRKLIRRAIRRGEALRLLALLKELIFEALDHAVRSRPAFVPLSEGIRAFVEASDPERNAGKLPPESLPFLSVAYGFLLSLAIRGRDPEIEYPECAGDSERILDLLKLDGCWLPERHLLEVARSVDEEKLVELEGSEDFHVSANARILLAAKDPGKHARDLPELFHLDFDYAAPLMRRIVDQKGDEALDAFMENFAENPHRDALEGISALLGAAGTKRAQAYFEDLFDILVDSVEANALLENVLLLATPNSAARLLELFRSGRMCFHFLVDHFEEQEEKEPPAAVRALAELSEEPVDPSALLHEGIAAYRSNERVSS